nr:MAG TPA: hypothetical protein [Caudoviricetes sp.]
MNQEDIIPTSNRIISFLVHLRKRCIFCTHF